MRFNGMLCVLQPDSAHSSNFVCQSQWNNILHWCQCLVGPSTAAARQQQQQQKATAVSALQHELVSVNWQLVAMQPLQPM
jgi:hypothetical protein